MNHYKVPAPSTCEYDQDVTSTITLDANDSFGLGVVEKQTMRDSTVGPDRPMGLRDAAAADQLAPARPAKAS